MPLYDVLIDNEVQEVFVSSRHELERAGYHVLPSRIHVGGKPTEESLQAAMMRGYKRQESKGAKFAFKKQEVINALS